MSISEVNSRSSAGLLSLLQQRRQDFYSLASTWPADDVNAVVPRSAIRQDSKDADADENSSPGVQSGLQATQVRTDLSAVVGALFSDVGASVSGPPAASEQAATSVATSAEPPSSSASDLNALLQAVGSGDTSGSALTSQPAAASDLNALLLAVQSGQSTRPS